MNIFQKFAAATAATALMATPIAAQATLDRASAPVTEESEVGGGSDFLNAAIIIALAGAGMAILLATDDDDPTSF